MNSTLETISPLRQRFLDEMRMRKLSPKTQSGYIRTVSRFYGWWRTLARHPTVEGVGHSEAGPKLPRPSPAELSLRKRYA